MYIFYHEFDSVSSGTAVVILNLIRGLVLRKQKVLLIAFVDGVLHNDLKDLDTGLLTVIDNDEKTIRRNMHFISGDDIIITVHYYSIFRLFKKTNPKIIFYCVNITSLPVANLYFGNIHIKSLTKKLIKAASESGGLLFIDEYALEENEELLGVSIANPAYLPIPVEVPATNLWLHSERPANPLSFTYVGRAADWKIFPVRKILKDAAMLDQPASGKIDFHIVTDDRLEFSRQIADVVNPAIAIHFYENLSQSELSAFLIGHSCLHFAMGTSSLDGAKLGVPTILVDFSYSEFPEKYRYNFLFDTKGNRVGKQLKTTTQFNGNTFEELVAFAKNEDKMNELSQRSYVYARDNHELGGITKMLIDFAAACKMHLKDTSRFLVRYW